MEQTSIPLCLDELPMPVTLRPAMPVSDEDLMRFSERNKPYRIERNKEGEITITTPVGGVGGNHEFLISAAFVRWMDAGADGMMFGPNTGSTCRTVHASRPAVRGSPRAGGLL
jgi:Uma2 family endonuclease